MFPPFSLPTATYQWPKLNSGLEPPLELLQNSSLGSKCSWSLAMSESTQQDLAKLVCHSHGSTGGWRSPDGCGHQERGGVHGLLQAALLLQ